MKTTSSINFYVAVDALDILPDELKRYADYANFFQHRILVGRALWKTDDETQTYTCLKRQYLVRLIPWRAFNSLRKTLVDLGVIESDGKYREGEKSYGYRIGDAYATAPIKRLRCRDDDLNAKIKDLRRRDLRNYTKVHRYLFRWLRKVEIDFPSAMAMLEQADVPDGRVLKSADIKELTRLACRIIRDKEDLPNVCPYGRVHSIITRLLSVIRSELRINNQRLVNIDIANSQPLFLALVVLTHLRGGASPAASSTPYSVLSLPSYSPPSSCLFPSPILTRLSSPSILPPPSFSLNSPRCSATLTNALLYDAQNMPHTDINLEYEDGYEAPKVPEDEVSTLDPSDDVTDPNWDLGEYIRLCEEGRLYDDLMNRINWKGSRGEFKEKEWFRFLYGQNRQESPLMEVFQRDFPTVWDFICRHKRKFGYAELAREMQRAESRLVIDTICGRLMDEHPDIPIVTIHDSLMTVPEHVELVKKVMVEEFGKIGLKPTLKVGSN